MQDGDGITRRRLFKFEPQSGAKSIVPRVFAYASLFMKASFSRMRCAMPSASMPSSLCSKGILPWLTKRSGMPNVRTGGTFAGGLAASASRIPSPIPPSITPSSAVTTSEHSVTPQHRHHNIRQHSFRSDRKRMQGNASPDLNHH